MDEPWFEELRDAGDSVRPTTDALPRLRDAVRRRRRARAAGAATGAAGLVVAVLAAVSVLPGSPGATPTPLTPAHRASPRCSTVRDGAWSSANRPRSPTSSGRSRSSPRQRSSSWEGFDVRLAASTHLGVVALVKGDLDAARAALPDVGVAHVYPWDDSAASVGVNAQGQVHQVLQWLLEPAVHDVRNAYRGVPGFESLGLWQEAGAVLLQWKAPVPDEIAALAGVRPDGVRVIVEPTRFSAHELRVAGQKAADASLKGRLDADWTSSYGCADGSGLVVGIEPESLADRRVTLQEALEAIAGMPVRVVPEEPARELTP